ncbi:MAG: hypothetical protein A2Y14_00010 [Verrucomicrobia bacterium GWF2_51_19]|nr:MAG: hypothetical protein A2Y14_00010 [Verrucomicrobia bacterium GWF2_51_19]
MRTETLYFIRFLEELHYQGKSVASVNFASFLEEYIADLDFNRSFFTQPEIENFINRYKGSMDLLLQGGSLAPAFEIFDAYKHNAEARIEWVLDRIEKPFDFTQRETFSPDRQNAPYPKDKAEADDLWTRRLKYELLNEILGQEKEQFDIHAVDKETLNKAKEAVRKRYETLDKNLDTIDSTDVQELFLNTLSHQFDPHSSFLSLDSMEDFSVALKNSLVGIGAYLSTKEGYCTVNEIFPGSPSEKTKAILPGDKILAVGQEEGPMVDIVGMKLAKAVKLIRGPKGTIVRLLIEPANGDPSNRKTVTLTRDEIKITENLAQARVYHIPQGNRMVAIGVIDLPSFYGSDTHNGHDNNTSDDVKELLLKLKAMHVEGIVLDFRFNGGGLLDEAIELTGLFVPGPVVQVKDMKGNITTYSDKGNNVVWKGPLIVLVSRFSASAAEIVAGALQSHHRALLVGDPSTHGKGTVQAVIEMDRLSFLPRTQPYLGTAKITIQKWYRPDGSSTQKRGVESDIAMPSFNQYLPIGESDLPHALDWDAIEPTQWNYDLAKNSFNAPLPPITQKLREWSQVRQSQLDEFSFLKDRIARFKEKQSQKTFSLNFEERQQMRKQDRVFVDVAEKKIREMAKNNYKYDEVLLDVAQGTKTKGATENQILTTPDISTQQEGKEPEKLPSFDIYMREALRIMTDWVSLAPPQVATN